MYYIIYKTTNTVNGKVYIGKHKTKDLDDGYLGSGKLLQRAIEKYGVENFAREIIHLCKTEEDMNTKEREIVTEDFCLREDTYNLCVGGAGGFSYINRNRFNVDIVEQRKRKPSIISTAAHNGGKKKKWLMENDVKHRQQSLKKMSKGLKEYYVNNEGHFLGKTHTEETKKKMSLAKKGKVNGNKNSQYGTMWITNGKENKKIKKESLIPAGWYRGRI